MTGSQKTLNIISILLIVYAVFMVLFGAFMVFGGSISGMQSEVVDIEGTSAPVSLWAYVVGIGSIFNGLIYLVIGILGKRGAKNPRKIMPFYALSIVGVVLGVINVVASIVQGPFDFFSVVGVLIVALCVYLARDIKKSV